ncbi:MAG: MBL fold metallo-hydrolase [Armatimonadetes bacterium]|nr:MBL fold metallo-hydrolase [Armatimonadota bacterium]
MHYRIHRGEREIGGMCIEVAAEDGTRILLDLGMPLVAPDGGDFPRDTPRRPTAELLAAGVLREIPGLYPHDANAPSIAAIFLTHSHLDHWGLVHHAHPKIPVFASQGTVAILEVGRVFFPDNPLPEDLRVLPTDECVVLGGMRVTGFAVDHAAPDSRALLVEADGQRLLYTGDLRAHGRTGFRFERLLQDERVHGVDWLLVEGTTLGSSGGGHGLRSESDVEEALVQLAMASREKLIAVAASGQNVDRLVSCFRAARRARRLLVVDAYQAFVLSRLSSLSANIPQFTWDSVRVSFSPYQVRRMLDAGLGELVGEMSASRVSSDELAARPGTHIACIRSGIGTTKLLSKIGSDGVEVVWSMWSGYWDRDSCALRAWTERERLEVSFVHSGGHAWPDDLARLVDRIQPRNTVWVHTDAEDPSAEAHLR